MKNGQLHAGRQKQHHTPYLAQGKGAMDIGGQKDFFYRYGLGAMFVN